uniref:Macro domain-containing protein n=1 Tax=Arcella intermedia TaxID=1963864 RepID=A0A6B2LJT1_9EUKA
MIVWQGNICLLEVDAIVNAANDYMLGCFTPNHACIDNVIHCSAGPRLRIDCRKLMTQQGHREPTGKAKITKAYHLPSKHVVHTVGPITQGWEKPRADLLASSYKSCLDVAKEHHLKSIAFCCISTGVFGYPNAPAVEVAVSTVMDWLEANPGAIDKVIFNVFKDIDAALYTNKFKMLQKEAQTTDPQ